MNHSILLFIIFLFVIATARTMSNAKIQVKNIGKPIKSNTTRLDTKNPQPKTYDNIWDEIRDNINQTSFDSQNKRVEYFIQYFLQHKRQLSSTLHRAKPYLYYVINELKKRDMPYEIAFLPAIESTFDPFAYSNRFAAGLWQITPITSMHYAVKQNNKEYGMKQNWWFNGRRDVMIATQFALSFLKELYHQFNSWELSLAAYNAGPRRIKKAIHCNKKLLLPTTYWDLKLPIQTEEYVPKLLAIAHIIKYSNQYNFDLQAIPNKPFFELVNIERQIALPQAAQLANLSLHEIRQLNPGYNQWATDPEGPFILLIPVSQVEIFKKNLKQLKSHEKITWHCYQVNSNDTLTRIAKQFKIPIKFIQHTNGLTSDQIYTGDSLVIPQHNQARDTTITNEEKKLYIHQIASNDTLCDISNKYRITIQDIIQWNSSLDIKNFTIGYKIKMYLPIDQLEKMEHIVQKGESLWSISKKYQINIHELQSWNQLDLNRCLQPMQKLIIWKQKIYPISMPEQYLNQNIIRKVFYTVKSGDSLNQIAKKFQINTQNIKTYNMLNTDQLYPGQTLTLPVDVTRAK